MKKDVKSQGASEVINRGLESRDQNKQPPPSPKPLRAIKKKRGGPRRSGVLDQSASEWVCLAGWRGGVLCFMPIFKARTTGQSEAPKQLSSNISTAVFLDLL